MADMSLRQLYELHQGKASDKWAIYLREYDRLLSPYRHLPFRMLEIGIQNGGSLEIWSKFFSDPRAIVGCDIDPGCANLRYENPCVSVVIGDANTDSAQARILEKSDRFDAIIDDGSHTSRDIVLSFSRYFPLLVDGGLFIAEDLHCTYWEHYQGGLLYPASSLEFFKRLADVIGHEHWGIPLRRGAILESFRREYGFEMDEEVLARIHSVEFINSMCIIRKEAPDQNVAGERLIVGQHASVVTNLETIVASEAGGPDERENKWSVRDELPEDELKRLRDFAEAAKLKIIEQRQSIEELAEAHRNASEMVYSQAVAIRAIRASTSWRVTSPIRSTGAQLHRARRVVRLSRVAAVARGGFWSATKKAIRILRTSGIGGLKQAAALLEQTSGGNGGGSPSDANYARWMADNESTTEESRAALRDRLATFSVKPTVSIVMPTFNGKPEWLKAAVESVQKQIYPHWELCIADDASSNAEGRDCLARYSSDDPRIKIVFRKENGHISAASNSAAELATGAWVVLMDHDDLLAEDALFWVVERINRCPDVRLIYSDEDKVDEAGVRSSPHFKPDWNIDLFYSYNFFCHLAAVRKDLFAKVGGFRVGFEGAQDYDLILRCIEHIDTKQIEHIPRILYHWRMHAHSTAKSGDAKPYAAIAGERALNEHFQRIGLAAKAEMVQYGYRVRYALPANLPMVSLLIPTRNAMQLLQQCIDSILEKTRYGNFEIIVIDNGSDEPQALDYLARISNTARVSVIRDDGEFNYSALNNSAVEHARGEILALVNNDIEVISPDWLGEMVSIAIQDGVGAVGARLLYPDCRLQHGGVVLGIGGVAGHALKYLPESQAGYFSRARLIQSYSAVTAACLVVRKDHYLAVGGLNQVELKVAFNDVDFCLRLREAGLRNVWSPYAELFHHESATRGAEVSPEKQRRFNGEVDYMLRRWGPWLSCDPAYNPNLTLMHEDFSYAFAPRLQSYKAA